MKTKMQIYFIVLSLSIIFPITTYGQIVSDSNSILYKKSISLVLQDLAFDRSLGGTFWINSDYSVVALIGLFYSKEEVSRSVTGSVYNKNISIYPSFSIRRHFYQKENITPFIGSTVKATFFRGDYDRSTYLNLGLSFGVESWLTNNITLTGEHSYYYSQSINNSNRDEYSSGNSYIIISFYF